MNYKVGKRPISEISPEKMNIITKKGKQTEIPNRVADMTVEHLIDLFDFKQQDLATKIDIDDLRSDIGAMKKENNELKNIK